MTGVTKARPAGDGRVGVRRPLAGARISGRVRGMETSLYLPVKRFLEARGFAVKGEICGCDLVAVPAAANGAGEGNGDAGDPPLVVIGELKQSFTLELLLQGVDRMAAGDEIWLAVRASAKRGRERDPRVRKCCRLLGFGLL